MKRNEKIIMERVGYIYAECQRTLVRRAIKRNALDTWEHRFETIKSYSDKAFGYIAGAFAIDGLSVDEYSRLCDYSNNMSNQLYYHWHVFITV